MVDAYDNYLRQPKENKYRGSAAWKHFRAAQDRFYEHTGG
jgi:hypothetical protein